MVSRRKQWVDKRMAHRTRWCGVACVYQRAGCDRTYVVRADVREAWVSTEDCPCPGSWDQCRPGRDPVVRSGAHTSRDPLHTGLVHNLVNRCSTYAEKDIV